MYVITGGAGFIGSNIAAALDPRGGTLSSAMGSARRLQMAQHRQASRVRHHPADATRAFLDANRDKIRASCIWALSLRRPRLTSTRLCATTFGSRSIFGGIARGKVPLYASSAATYGDGREGFLDRFDADYLSRLRPLNAYGWSKALFDRWVLHSIETSGPVPPRWAGLKFFILYGPTNTTKAASARSPFNCTGRFAIGPGSFVSLRKPRLPRRRSAEGFCLGRRLCRCRPPGA